jgi:HupE / UreJ protein
MTRRCWLLALVLTLLALSRHASAHKPSDSYLLIQSESGNISGRWDIALRDLDDALGLDRDGDGAVTWGELRGARPRIEAYARASLQAAAADSTCPLSFPQMEVIRHSDGAYAALGLAFACPDGARKLRLHYDLLFALDAQHRGVVRAPGSIAPVVLTKTRPDVELSLGHDSKAGSLFAMVRLGIEHILHGYDHLLFLTALLLPSVLRRKAEAWVPVEDFRSVFVDVLRVVSAFTLAHSLTLGLAAAQLVALPPRFVEAAIAFSVVLAALNNLFPLVRTQRWAAAFCLGLLHGFGFAATLSDVGLSGLGFARTLLGFNLGVEIGQLGVVLLLLPLIYAARRSPRYLRFGLQLGSSVVLLVSCIWLVERAFDLRIIS